MKLIKYFNFILLVLMLAGCSPKEKKPTPNDVIHLTTEEGSAFLYTKEDVYNAGKVLQGTKVTHSFVIENRGKIDLVLKTVEASCGCTVAKWDKKPIPSGKSSNIDVTFNSANRFGPQSKIITIVSNGVPDTKRVELKCEVIVPNN